MTFQSTAVGKGLNNKSLLQFLDSAVLKAWENQLD